MSPPPVQPEHERVPCPWHKKFAKDLLKQPLPAALMVIGRGAEERIYRKKANDFENNARRKELGDGSGPYVAKPLPEEKYHKGGDGLQRLCLYLAREEIVKTDPAAAAGRQLLESGYHPDLHVVQREQPKNKDSRTERLVLRQQITIDQIRDVNEELQLTPLRAQRRVAVIMPACRMSRPAANSLLKLLEEPPAATCLILAVERPHLLPATIRSRCTVVTSPRPSPAQAQDCVKAEFKDVKNAKAMLAMTGGAPLDVGSIKAHAEANWLLADICSGRKFLVGQQHKLDNLTPAIWLPWALDWAVEGARMACGLPYRDENLADVAKKNRRAPKEAWFKLYDELLQMHAMVDYAVVNRLMLERTAWLFGRLRAQDRR